MINIDYELLGAFIYIYALKIKYFESVSIT